MKTYQKIILHVLGWIFLYLLPYLFSFPGLPNYATMFSNPGDYIHLVSTIILILFSYFNYFYLVPRFYFKRSIILYCFIILGCFWLTISLPALLVPHPEFRHMSPPDMGQPMPLLFGRNYNILLFIISVAAAIVISTSEKLRQSENQKAKAELLFLKAQINPHFLFNTLNSIYALAIDKDENTPNAIVQLSELMRYIIKDAHEDKVPLEKELLTSTIIYSYRNPVWVIQRLLIMNLQVMLPAKI